MNVIKLMAFLFVGMGGVMMTSGVARGGQTQAEMNRTAGADYKQADADMNRAYKKLMGVLDAKQKAKLKAAQLLWLKFRDGESLFRASKSEGGSVQPMVRALYLAKLTRHRTQELREAHKQFTTEGEL